MKIASLLSAVRERHAGGSGSIRTADAYAKTVGKLRTDAAAARAAVRRSAARLTFRNTGMIVLGGSTKRGNFGKASNLKPTAGAVMDFACVLTSARRDRDRDVINPAGVEVDSKMPLLWQHMPDMPIGRYVRSLGRDEDKITIQCAIADTALGRDSATLVEFGALRISHGFQPEEYEPLTDDEGKETGGWHIKRCQIMEASLVSVPSNTDSIITTFSRGKLHHPAVKAWAGSIFQSRPKVVPSGFGGSKSSKGGKGSSTDILNDIREKLDAMTKALSGKGKPSKGKRKPGRGKKEDDPNKPTTLADLTEALAALADMELPREAAARVAVAAGMVESVSDAMTAYAETVSGDVGTTDLSALAAGAAAARQAVSGGLSRLAAELETISKLDGLSEEATQAVSAVAGQVGTLAEAVADAQTAAEEKVTEDDDEETDDEESDDDEETDEEGTPAYGEGEDDEDDDKEGEDNEDKEDEDDEEKEGETDEDDEESDDDTKESDTDDDKEGEDDDEEDDTKEGEDEDKEDEDEDDDTKESEGEDDDTEESDTDKEGEDDEDPKGFSPKARKAAVALLARLLSDERVERHVLTQVRDAAEAAIQREYSLELAAELDAG